MAHNNTDQKLPILPVEEKKIIFTDPKIIRIILHEQKLQILNIVLKEMKNIQELKDLTGINPGTIKRNLDELMEVGLVEVAETKMSNYNIKMKYYRAVGTQFELKFQLPLKNLDEFLDKSSKNTKN
jgi:DNA-binding IclR family transcriptional regulator